MQQVQQFIGDLIGPLTGLLGIAAILAAAFAFSDNRREIDRRIIVGGLGLQLVAAVLILRVPGVSDIFDAFSRLVVGLLGFSERGSSFLFGPLGLDDGPLGLIFAFRVLPVIVFFSALIGALYHLGVMPRVIAGLAWVFRRVVRITGIEALGAAANVFVGFTEAPLCIKPYLPRMTRSQLMLTMTTGFATIAGSVLLTYIEFLGGSDPEQRALFAKHLLTASLMSAPGAFVIAKILVPETEAAPDETLGGLHPALHADRKANLLDAITSGATDGLRLAANVAAMLIAFVAIIAMLNWPLEWFGEHTQPGRWLVEQAGVERLGFEVLLGWLFTPVALLIGIPWGDAPEVGSLLGIQLVATEFLAYERLGGLVADGDIAPRSQQLAAYALCGFCNFASIGIQVGGLAVLAPSRRADIARLGLRAMFGGAMACWMTGAVAGLVIG